MRKTMMSLLVLAVVFALMACGGAKVDHSDWDGSNLTVVLVTDGSGIDDKSFNAATWRGILRFFDETPPRLTRLNKSYSTVHSPQMDQIYNNLAMASDEQPDLIIGTGFNFADPIQTAARNFPSQNYFLVDTAVEDIPNLRTAVFSEHEGAFLAGVAVASRAKEDGIANPVFAFLGGMQGDVIERFHVGYAQGVWSVLPGAEIRDFYAGSWGAPEIGKTKAREWFDTGVYAVFAAAGGTGSGVIAQAKEHRIDGRNVWAIGVDSDQYDDGLYKDAQGNETSAVFTSAIKLVENAVFDVLTLLENGGFEGGVVYYNLANDGLDISHRNVAMTPEIIKSVDELRMRIIAGEITVYPTYREALRAGLVPAGLSLPL